MLKRLIKALSSVPATAISGIFLILSMVLSHKSPLDPAWITVIISGLPLLHNAVRKLIVNKGISKISSALLITVAMIAAIAIGDLFAAGEVAFIMALGEILEDITTGRARRGLKKLMSLAPTTGRRIVNGKEEAVPAADIKEGDILRILPGETVPVDGVIISGDTSIDQSVVTGESMPVDKAVGDAVFCGTVNRFGAVDIRATAVGEDSSLQKLIRLVKEAESKKAPMARIADKSASFLVPAALIIALITWLVTENISRAVTVLVVFCPCALVLATPTAIMAAIGQGAKRGVIIKSGRALEIMSKVDTVAFDKTGTLTHGTPTVCGITTFDGAERDYVFALAAGAESKSEHPLGKAITAAAEKKGLSIKACTEFKMTVGRGVFAVVDGKAVLCGGEALLKEHGIAPSKAQAEAVKAFQSEGKAAVLVAEADRILGVIALADTLRPEAAEVVDELKAIGTESVLLTGDNGPTATQFATEAHITALHWGLLPWQKVERIADLQKNGRTVCMVGDGINDAPSLKAADVGIAMGSMGSDIAVEAADIALMGDSLKDIGYLKRLARATVRTIKFSITLSMLINIAAVTLSVLGLLNPTTGALVHNAGSVFVILIAALLYDREI